MMIMRILSEKTYKRGSIIIQVKRKIKNKVKIKLYRIAD